MKRDHVNDIEVRELPRRTPLTDRAEDPDVLRQDVEQSELRQLPLADGPRNTRRVRGLR